MVEPVVDGRTARRDRNREAVLDAVLKLFAEDQLFPSAPQVAERSGVSLRSVFRYYEDTEALSRAAMARHLERVGPLFVLPDVEGASFDERVERFVTARLALYEAVAPSARAALVRGRSNTLVADQLAWARRQGREAIGTIFATELSTLPARRRRAVLDAVDVLFQFEGVEHLRVTLVRSRTDTADVLGAAIRSQLTPG